MFLSTTRVTFTLSFVNNCRSSSVGKESAVLFGTFVIFILTNSHSKVCTFLLMRTINYLINSWEKKASVFQTKSSM